MDQLEDDALYYAQIHRQRAAQKSSKIIDAVIKLGLAKDSKSAQIVLIVFVGMCVVISIFLLVRDTSTGVPTPIEDVPEYLKDALSKDFLDKLPSSQK